MGHDAPQATGQGGVIYTDGSVVTDAHGTCTTGIVFADGNGNMQAQEQPTKRQALEHGSNHIPYKSPEWKFQ